MRNSSGLYNSNSHSQVLDTHTRTHIVKNMPWRLGLGWGWSHQHTRKSLDTIHTHKHTHTHVTPTPTPLHHTQAAFPALNGCRDRGVMASLWADVQLGMLDVQAGIPGKAKKLWERNVALTGRYGEETLGMRVYWKQRPQLSIGIIIYG